MRQYVVTIARYDDDGSSKELVYRYISADDAIDLMIHIDSVATGGDEREGEEEAEAAPEPEPQHRFEKHTAKGSRAPRKCSQCGQPGHTYRTCGKKSLTSPEPAQAEDDTEEPEDSSEPAVDHRSLRERVKELWEAGVGLEDVFDSLPSDPIPEVNAIYRDLERKRLD